jgi:hypothetical protein
MKRWLPPVPTVDPVDQSEDTDLESGNRFMALGMTP